MRRLLSSALSSLALTGAPAGRSSLRFVSASVASLPPLSVTERRSDIVAPPLDERAAAAQRRDAFYATHYVFAVRTDFYPRGSTWSVATTACSSAR